MTLPVRSVDKEFAPPPARPGHIARQAVLLRAAAQSDRRVMVIDAPAGYGKTTFAAQACAQDPRPVVWVGLREADNDPVRLLARLMRALADVDEADPERAAPGPPATSLEAAMLARLVGSLPTRVPTQLVLDDVQAVVQSRSMNVVSSLVEQWPAGSRLVLVSRSELELPLARFQAAQDLCEVHLGDLALTCDETAQLLQRLGTSWPPVAMAELFARTEGWAAGVALAGMAFPELNQPGLPDGLSGRRREVADYFFYEVLDQLPEELRVFMLSTSVVRRLSAPLCDFMTKRADSGRMLLQLDHTNAFVVPLDGERSWYRYHHLFGEMLRAELDREDPQAARALLERAAAWHERYGSADEAFAYSRSIGDLDRAGRVLLGRVDDYIDRGLVETLRNWLRECSEDEIQSDPKLAIGAGWVVSQLGETLRARRYLNAATRFDLDVASPDGATTLRASMVALRSALGLGGAAQVLEDGQLVCASEAAAGTRWLIAGYRACGTAHLWLGQAREAIAGLNQVIALTQVDLQPRHVRVLCLGFLGLAYLDLGDLSRAGQCWREADDLGTLYTQTIYCLPGRVVHAAVVAKEGRVDEARSHLQAVAPLLSLLAPFPTWHADLSARCGEVAFEVDERGMATVFYDAARCACGQIPDAGPIPARLDRLRQRMDGAGQPIGALTPAELRVLRQLATHRKLQEIAQHLYVSRTTVKTQVASIYAKLGVSTRAEAVEALDLASPSVLEGEVHGPRPVALGVTEG